MREPHHYHRASMYVLIFYSLSVQLLSGNPMRSDLCAQTSVWNSSHIDYLQLHLFSLYSILLVRLYFKMSHDGYHLNLRDSQGPLVKTYACPYCPSETGFTTEQSLYSHAVNLHPTVTGNSQQSPEFAKYRLSSSNHKVYVKILLLRKEPLPLPNLWNCWIVRSPARCKLGREANLPLATRAD